LKQDWIDLAQIGVTVELIDGFLQRALKIRAFTFHQRRANDQAQGIVQRQDGGQNLLLLEQSVDTRQGGAGLDQFRGHGSSPIFCRPRRPTWK
jgi:hypothetical protein